MFITKHNSLQVLRFCTVGAGNTAVDFAAFYILTRAGLPYLGAQVISYSAGVINSFYFNRKWTFRAAGKTNIPEVARFIILNGLSLLVSAGLLFTFRDICQLGLWASKLLATGAGMSVNFIGSRCWVFKKNQTRGDLCEN